MFPGCLDPVTGRLRISFAAPVNPSFNHGIAFGSNFVYVADAGVPAAFVNGLPVTAAGSLCANGGGTEGFQNGIPFGSGIVTYDTSGAIASYVNGLPMTATNRLACTQ